jgi:hypothetical protein
MFDEEFFCQAFERSLAELRHERLRQTFLAKLAMLDETQRDELEDSVARFRAESAHFQKKWRISMTLFFYQGVDAKSSDEASAKQTDHTSAQQTHIAW